METITKLASRENKMCDIRIEKITLNIGVGNDQNKLERAQLLIKHLTGIDSVKTFAKKRIPSILI